jgi:hypothetical protein
MSRTLPFAEHRKSDWISDVKSTKRRRKTACSKNDRLRSAPPSSLVGYMRVSKADGSQVVDLQRHALLAAGSLTATSSRRPSEKRIERQRVPVGRPPLVGARNQPRLRADASNVG